jgi:hypothetical protein
MEPREGEMDFLETDQPYAELKRRHDADQIEPPRSSTRGSSS